MMDNLRLVYIGILLITTSAFISAARSTQFTHFGKAWRIKEVPKHELLAYPQDVSHYQDAFGIKFKVGNKITASDLGRQIKKSSPIWVQAGVKLAVNPLYFDKAWAWMTPMPEMSSNDLGIFTIEAKGSPVTKLWASLIIEKEEVVQGGYQYEVVLVTHVEYLGCAPVLAPLQEVLGDITWGFTQYGHRWVAPKNLEWMVKGFQQNNPLSEF